MPPTNTAGSIDHAASEPRVGVRKRRADAATTGLIPAGKYPAVLTFVMNLGRHDLVPATVTKGRVPLVLLTWELGHDLPDGSRVVVSRIVPLDFDAEAPLQQLVGQWTGYLLDGDSVESLRGLVGRAAWIELAPLPGADAADLVVAGVEPLPPSLVAPQPRHALMFHAVAAGAALDRAAAAPIAASPRASTSQSALVGHEIATAGPAGSAPVPAARPLPRGTAAASRPAEVARHASTGQAALDPAGVAVAPSPVKSPGGVNSEERRAARRAHAQALATEAHRAQQEARATQQPEPSASGNPPTTRQRPREATDAPVKQHPTAIAGRVGDLGPVAAANPAGNRPAVAAGGTIHTGPQVSPAGPSPAPVVSSKLLHAQELAARAARLGRSRTPTDAS